MQIANKISKHFIPLLVIGLVANATGLLNDILEPDGALYATIAKTIVLKNDWINLYVDGGDWLDKPHLPFWLAAISFKIFGINSFAYKLPSFLCFLLGVFYTYKLAAKIYCKQLAQIASIIYIGSLHVILCNFDVRAEAYLTAFIIAAIYHFYCALQSPWFKHIVAAALYAGLAMMTKGIFVLITIASGFIVYWIVTKQWKELINPKWYLLLILCFVFITPELYCLYQQFDLHPEKFVSNSFTKYNVSGIKFFFWDSQFGRFFNTGPIQGKGDISFFLHTTLWAFLPWSFYLILIIYNRIKNRKSNKPTKAIIINAAAIISFIIFSVSKFQLPHYIVIIFPLFSIIVANYLLGINSSKTIQLLSNIHTFLFTILLLFIGIVAFFYHINNLFYILAVSILITLFFFFRLKHKTLYVIVAKGLCFSMLLAVFLNLSFYPQLMQYQAGMMAGKWQQKNLPNTTVSMLRCDDYSFQFYANTVNQFATNASDLFKKNNRSIVFLKKKEIQKINADSFNVVRLEAFPYFHISTINATFFNNKTRWQTLDTILLVELKKVK
jgi:4-amino-4-deoxy-L-arabinose transferase-like glycosyltransferase